MREEHGRASIKLRYNDLVREAGGKISRNNYNKDAQSVLWLIKDFLKKNGNLPYSHDLKACIGVASNTTVFKAVGGYLKFLAKHGLINLEHYQRGMITAMRTYGLDRRLYESRCEAMLANFFYRNKIQYIPQVSLGTFRHSSIALRLDFLIDYNAIIAIEVDGMGNLRQNLTNLEEKKRRAAIYKWRWLILSRNKVRYLCLKEDLVYWEQLVSSAEILHKH